LAKIAAQAASDVVKYANALGLTPTGRERLVPAGRDAGKLTGLLGGDG